MKAKHKWNWLIETKRLDLKLNWQNYDNCLYYVIRKSTDDKVGEISCLHDGQIVFEIFEPYRGAGYASEALKALLANIPKCPRPFMRIRKGDEYSIGVAQKSNFRKEPNVQSDKFELWLYST